MLPLLLALTAAAPAQDAEEEAPKTKTIDVADAPFVLDVPDVEDGPPIWYDKAWQELPVNLEIAHTESSSIVGVAYVELFQADLSTAVIDALPFEVNEIFEAIEDLEAPSPDQLVREEHPEFGNSLTWQTTLDYSDDDDPTDRLERQIRMRMVEAPMGTATWIAMSPALKAEEEGQEAEEVAWPLLDEAMGMVRLTKDKVDPSTFQTGQVELPAGWSVKVPDGWRLLTNEELVNVSGSRVGGTEENASARSHAVFIDPSRPFGSHAFSCSAVAYPDGPPEVVDEAKSPQTGSNYRTFAHLRLRGGKYKNGAGHEVELPRVEDLVHSNPVKLDNKPVGTLETVDLGDREAFLWTTDGTRSDKPVQIKTFSTSWGDIGLDCYEAIDPETEDLALLDVFDKTVRTIKVIDGENHPMHLSIRSQYRKHWPFTHPALQIWWGVLILLGLGVWLAIRGD